MSTIAKLWGCEGRERSNKQNKDHWLEFAAFLHVFKVGISKNVGFETNIVHGTSCIGIWVSGCQTRYWRTLQADHGSKTQRVQYTA